MIPRVSSQESSYAGKLIAVEGIDGSGKSTQVYLLEAFPGLWISTPRVPFRELPHPFGVAPAHCVAGEGGVKVAIRQNDIACPQERADLPFVSIRKVRGMNQRKCGGGQQLPFLAFLCDLLHN